MRREGSLKRGGKEEAMKAINKKKELQTADHGRRGG